MTDVRRERYLWLTWLSKLMAGETTCAWSPWFRVRIAGYKRVPSDFDADRWSAAHNLHLSRLIAERESLGERIRSKSQNLFKLPIAPGMTLAGSPDLVATAPDGKITVYTVRIGEQRPRDVDQVMLAMLYLPKTRRYLGQPIHGCVVSSDGRRTPLPASFLSQYFEDQAQQLIDLLNSDSSPARAPSPHECRFCDLTLEDCPDREDRPPLQPDLSTDGAAFGLGAQETP